MMSVIFAGIIALFFWKSFLGYVSFPADTLYERWYPWKASATEPVKSFNPFLRDPAHQMYPLQQRTLERMRQMEAPLWNPDSLFGMPNLGANQEGPLYPFNAIYLAMPFGAARNLDLAIHQFIGALGMGLLVTSIGGSLAGGILAGLAFAFSGTFIGWLQYAPAAHKIALFPWCLLLSYRIVSTPSRRNVITFGLIIGMLLWVGYAEFVLYNIFGIAIFVLYHLWRLPMWRLRIVAALGLASACIIGFLLGLPQVLPMLELYSLSDRPATGYSQLAATGMPLYGLTTAVAPFMVGSPSLRNHTGDVPYIGMQLYAGFVLLIIVASNLTGLWKDPQARPFFFIAAFSLLVSMGTPFLRLMLVVLPPLGSLRFIHRLTYLYTPAVCVLGGLALTRHLARIERGEFLSRFWLAKRLFVAIALAVVATSAVLVFHEQLLQLAIRVYTQVRGFGFRREETVQIASSLLTVATIEILGVLMIIAVYAGLVRGAAKNQISLNVIRSGIVAVLAIELLIHAWLYNPMVDLRKYPPSPNWGSIALLKGDSEPFRVVTLASKTSQQGDVEPPFPPNTLAQYGISDTAGYLSLLPRRSVEFIEKVGGGGDQVLRNFAWLSKLSKLPAVSLLNAKYIIVNPADPDPIDGPLVYAGEVKIFRNLQYLPRAFFVKEARTFSDSSRVLEELTNESFQPDQVVLLEEVPASPPDSLNCKENIDSAVSISRYQPEDVEIHVKSGTSGFLFVSDSYYPGWTAEVDGEGATIYRANFAFRAVALGCGEHVVRFRYLPTNLQLASVLSIATVLVSVVGFVKV